MVADPCLLDFSPQTEQGVSYDDYLILKDGGLTAMPPHELLNARVEDSLLLGPDPTAVRSRRNRHGIERLFKMVAVTASLLLVVSCSTVSKILTDSFPDEKSDSESVTGGSRIPLPPNVEDFDHEIKAE